MLYCPQDSAHAGYATNFDADLKNKISYFVGLAADFAHPVFLLSGDDHFFINHRPAKPGLVEMASSTHVAWSTNRHVSAAKQARAFENVTAVWENVVLADGSVQSLNNSGLTNILHHTGLATNRLVIP